MLLMASLRSMSRKDGTEYVQVLYRLNGKQTSTSFEDAESATKFKALVEAVGPKKALASVGADPALSTMTVGQWVEHYIEHRTGLAKSTMADYRSYAKTDITQALGPIPLSALTREDVAKWTQEMADAGKSGKTISNKAAFLARRSTARWRPGVSRQTQLPVTGCRAASARTWCA